MRPMVIIESRSEGFRRAGVAHPARPVEYPDDRFSSEELAVLRSEPMLIVTEAAQTPEEAPEKETAPKKKKRKS